MGAEFFNDTPKNLWIDEEAWAKIQRNLDILMKFNIMVDAMCKNFNGWYVIHDTKLHTLETA